MYYGWDDPLTAEYYECFCEAHSRYRKANEALIAAAGILGGMRILDVGAGTGRTAESALPYLGDGAILCVDPAESMRAAGQRRITDRRVSWAAELPDSEGLFDRILWGAGIWQLPDWESGIRRLASLMKPGGALCFTIPSLYLGIPDEPGGGSDPLLLSLPSLLFKESLGELGEKANPCGMTGAGMTGVGMTVVGMMGVAAVGCEEIQNRLITCGLEPQFSQFRLRISQAGLKDWLKIPVMTNRMMPGLDAVERARRIDEAYEYVDSESWKWEGWIVWAAWKR